MNHLTFLTDLAFKLKLAFIGLFLLGLLGFHVIYAQPTVFGSQLVDGNYVKYDLTDKGSFKTVRLQATSSASSGQRNWEFASGTASNTNYSDNWRPYNAGKTLSAYDTKIDPSTQEASARYNDSSGGQSGLLPAVASGNYYTVIVGENGPTSNNFMSIIETTFNPKTIDMVSQSPTNGNVLISQDVTVTIEMSNSLSGTEAVYVRYTTDGFTSSSFAQATGSGSTLTATIPGQSAGTIVQYYVLSTKSSITLTHEDADFQTLELNNGGSNYSYTVNNQYGNTTGGNCDGSWNDPDCWLNGAIPPSGASIEILEDITLDQNATVSSLTISSSKTLTSESGAARTLTISSGGTFTNNGGTFTANDGTVSFPGSGTISGTTSFNNVDIASGGVDFGSGSTITGILTINNGGFVQTNPPDYDPGSTLKYNTGSSFARSTEWNSPHHVQLSTNGTTLNMGSGNTTMAGSLTIDANCTLNTDASSGTFSINGSAAISGSLNMGGSINAITVGQDLTLSGILTLGSFSSGMGGDLNLAGNFVNSGTFNCNERAVFFNGSTNQTISGSASPSIDYMIVNNSSGVTLANNATIDNQLSLTNGTLALGSNTLTMNAGATFAGSFSGSNMINDNGSGMIHKFFAGSEENMDFTFPIGTGSDYSPVTLTPNGLSSANVTVSITASIHPNNGSTSDYINRYWDVSGAGISSYNITCQYADGDIAGDEDNIYGGKYNGSTWELLEKANTGANTFTGTGLQSFSAFTGAESAFLPVELILFHARKSGPNTQLSWQTASEINNDYFDIQRSSDSRNWQTIGTVQGQGTTFDIQSYSFTDAQPLTGMNYYRLQQVDFDGAYVYSVVVSVDFENNTSGNISPNPVQHKLFIQLPGDPADANHTFIIFDLNGKQWKQTQLTGPALNVSDLPAGTYFIRVTNEKGQVLLQECFLKN